ncbi:MAG: glycosyltransferase [Candidatus Latescibacteria bacterium]|jgi:glycosyltransferase involved in cell wall biosynthesis|nr:glycosyltransferase [Candidatus Latescibacterota bacterium]
MDRLNVGGSAHHVLLASEALNARGYQTVLVKGDVAPGEAEMRDLIRQTGAKPRHVPGLGRALSIRQDWGALVRLYRIVRAVRPSVVETHKSKAGVLGRLAAWLAGAPVVVHTYHGHVFHGYFSRWKSRLIVLLERLLAHWTDAVVAVSYRQRDELLDYRIASRDRLHAVPYGLKLGALAACERDPNGFRAEIGVSPTAPLVGTVTRLTPIKGMDVFLDAAQIVARDHPEARFPIVGDGELRPELEDQARRLDLEGRALFVGIRHEMLPVYQALDLVVLSSHNEGLPLALIEAIAAGCYVVASRVGGVSELVPDPEVGITVPPGDASALADAISVAVREGRRVPAARRELAARLYGVDRMAEDLDRLYRTLLVS